MCHRIRSLFRVLGIYNFGRGPKLQSCKSHLIIWWSYAGRMVHFFRWLIMISSKFKIYAGQSLWCIQFGFQNWRKRRFPKILWPSQNILTLHTHKCSFSIMGPHIFNREHSCLRSLVCCCSCWSDFSFFGLIWLDKWFFRSLFWNFLVNIGSGSSKKINQFWWADDLASTIQVVLWSQRMKIKYFSDWSWFHQNSKFIRNSKKEPPIVFASWVCQARW